MQTWHWTRNGMMGPNGEDGDSSLDYVTFTFHAAEVERLTAENKKYVDDLMNRGTTMINVLTVERDALAVRLAEIEAERDAAVARAETLEVANRMYKESLLKRDSSYNMLNQLFLDAVAAKDRTVEALQDLYKSLLIHEGEDIMGRVKGTWNSKAAEKACVLIAEIIAGHVPVTTQTDPPHIVIHRAVLDVIAATGAYLPPDGIEAQECINRVLQATDNAEIVAALNELERNPYKLPAKGETMSDPWENYCSAWDWYVEADSLLDWWVENGNPERSCAHNDLIDTIELANDEQERAYEAYQSTRTAQAAPSDREKRLEEALRVIVMYKDMPGAKIALAALAQAEQENA